MDNPPHPFAMANHAYHNMIHERKDQVIHMQIKKIFAKSYIMGFSSASW